MVRGVREPPELRGTAKQMTNSGLSIEGSSAGGPPLHEYRRRRHRGRGLFSSCIQQLYLATPLGPIKFACPVEKASVPNDLGSLAQLRIIIIHQFQQMKPQIIIKHDTGTQLQSMGRG